MGDIPNRANWLFGLDSDLKLDKSELIRHYVKWMLEQTVQMFEYGSLPETVPQKELEILHQLNGFAIWKKVKGKLYVFFGGLGGELDEYYHPTIATISNSYLNYSGSEKIGVDCVVTFNNKLREGLLPLFKKHAILCAETDISIQFALVNTRIPYLVNANDDNTRTSVQQVLKQIWDGEKFGVILNKQLLDKNGVFTAEFGTKNQNVVKDLIELKQYLVSRWYLDIGIQSNYNMKRESLNSSETTMDEGVLLPLIDDMLETRQTELEEVNKMFGTNITVKLSSTWEKIREEIRNEIKKQESEIQQKPEEQSGSKEEQSGKQEDSAEEQSGKEDGKDEKETN